jgi:molybdate transport system substrate-binding protein
MRFELLRYRFCLAAVLALFVSCSQEAARHETVSKAGAPAKTESPAESLIVSAAASTKEVVEALVGEFEAATGTKVTVNPGPSSGLAGQIIAGAPADLFLSASQQWADEVNKKNKASAMARLLTNKLVIVVPAVNPGSVHEPKDLLSPAVKKVALAGEKVPAGAYADQALAKLELLQPLESAGKIVRGQDVRSALSYVERGEAEAGIVYSTDLSAATGVKPAYEFDPSLHDDIVYVLVLLKDAGEKPAAKKLYEYLQAPAAEATYAKFGFSRLR